MDQPWSNCFQLRYKQLQNQLLSKTHLTWTLASCNGRASRSWAVTLRNKSRTYQLTNYHYEHHNWKSRDKANITFNFWWIHVEIMESLSKQPFWAMDGKRKWTFCMPSKWSLPNIIFELIIFPLWKVIWYHYKIIVSITMTKWSSVETS